MEQVSLNKNSFAALCAVLVRRRLRRRRPRKYWVHPVLADGSSKGKFVLIHRTLIENPGKFFEFYRMSVPSFALLLSKVEGDLSKQYTRVRDCVSAEEKLAVTLRYLATGKSFRSLHFEFLLGRSTIAEIIRDTCAAIWTRLKTEYMQPPTTEDWLNIADQFEKRANFPHCVGAIDGNHIRIINPKNSGSEYFNYKKHFSVVLMAIADSNYCFTYIDVGSFGHDGDSNILKSTDVGKQIYSQTLNLPQPTSFPNCPSQLLMPYVFVADEAFAVSENVLRPYPAKNLTTDKKIFNYRLSRGRRYVECAFGILTNKWRILHRPIDVDVNFADSVIQACCVLHNFVRKLDGYNFEDTLACSLDSIPSHGTRGSITGKNVRDNFMNYFCSAEGSLPWQNDCI